MVAQMLDGYSTAGAARVLNLTPNRVRQLLAAGQLKHIVTPVGRVIDPEDLARFAQECADRREMKSARPLDAA